MYHNSYELLKQGNFNVGMLFLEDTSQEVYMNVMKQRSLSATYTFTKIYGGTKTTLTSRIKKGAGKGGVRKTTFYKQSNTFENLTWMEK